MMPSREHFLLKRRSALSTFSFSPTLTVDIPFNPPSPQALFCYPVIITVRLFSVKSFFRIFRYFFPLFAICPHETAAPSPRRVGKNARLVRSVRPALPPPICPGRRPSAAAGMRFSRSARNPPPRACTGGRCSRRAGSPLRRRSRRSCTPSGGRWDFSFPRAQPPHPAWV